MNTAYIELAVEDTKKGAYVLADKLKLNNFKIVDEHNIRIYDNQASTQEISKILSSHDVEIVSIGRKSETLEDYFLKMTGEAGI